MMDPTRTDRPVAAEYDIARRETRDGDNEVISGQPDTGDTRGVGEASGAPLQITQNAAQTRARWRHLTAIGHLSRRTDRSKLQCGVRSDTRGGGE